MAVAHDTVSNPPGMPFTADTTWSHAPVGVPRGVAVFVIHDITGNDQVVGVTYGSVPLTRIAFAADTDTELGSSYAYFLGSSVPAGSLEDVSIDLIASPVGNHAAWCYTLTASGDTEVVASNTRAGDEADPSLTLSTTAGFNGLAYGSLFSGFGTVGVVTPGSGYTKVDLDLGISTAHVEHGAKSGANVVVNFSTGGAGDDIAMVAIAVSEVASEATGSRGRLFTSRSTSW